MKYLIIIHMRSRDRYWAEYVRQKIEARGKKNQVKIITFDEILPEVIRKGFRPDSILMYTLRDEASVQWITLLKIISGAKVVVYENEGLMDFDDREFIRKRIGDAPRSVGLIDRYYYWGVKPARVSAEVLLEKGFIKDRDAVSYCGYINYEMKSKDLVGVLTEEEKAFLQKIQDHCQGKKMILALTGFSITDLSDEEFRMDGEIITDDPEKVHAYAETQRKNASRYRGLYVDLIRKIAEIHPEIPIVVKPHPSENERAACMQYYLSAFESCPNVMVLDRAIIVGLLLDETRLLIHYGSTVALEAYIRKIPSLLYEDESYHGNGGLMKSTKKMTGEADDHVLDGLTFRSAAENDSFLKEIFNFDPEAEYRPSDELIRCLEDTEHRYPLDRKDLGRFINRKEVARILFRNCLGRVKRGKVTEAVHTAGALYAFRHGL